MSGNITEEQFVKFCEDFVEKYEGRNFQELVRSLGSDISVAYHGKVNTSLTFTEANFGMYFGKYNELSQAVFGYLKNDKTIFINSFVVFDNYFHNIEDIYKLFKMNEKENKETIEITLEVNLEDILKIYKEDISKKLGIASENIKINLKRG